MCVKEVVLKDLEKIKFTVIWKNCIDFISDSISLGDLQIVHPDDEKSR
jgi:hypothetical protein